MKKNRTIDFMKFVAMFFIVSIHSGTVMGIEIAGINGDKIDKLIEVIGRFAVPFFFIASGFLFTRNIQTKEKPLYYLLNYLRKLILLYISWFLIYAVYDLWKVLWETGNYSISDNEEALAYLESIYTKEVFIYGVGHTQYHLWFLPALIWPISFIYIFYKIKLMDFLLVAGFFLHLIGLIGQGYSFLVEEFRYTTRDPFFFGLFYVTLGSFFALHYQRIKQIAEKVTRHDYIFLIITLVLLQLGERTIIMEYLDGGPEEYFLTTIPLSISIFLFCVKFQDIGEGSLFNRIGRNAVGIFVIHPLIISITNVLLNEVNATEWKGTLLYGFLFTPLIFFLSYYLYQLIQKLKKNVLHLRYFKKESYSKD